MRRDWRPVVGIDQLPKKLARRFSLRKHRTWVLSPAPRMSHPTTSNRPWPAASRFTPSSRTCWTEPAGPPGFTNIEPIRSSGRLARWRITASLILRPRGWSQSSGTRTFAHSSCSPQPVQAIPLFAGPTSGVVPGGAAAAGLVATVIRRDIPTRVERPISPGRRALVLDPSAVGVVVKSKVSSAIPRQVDSSVAAGKSAAPGGLARLVETPGGPSSRAR